MKKILVIILVIIGLGYTIKAQNKDDRRYIEVTGSAELQVTPDEIYLSIALNEKDMKDRRSLDELEADVVAVLRRLSIPTENLSIAGANSKLEKAFWTGKKIYARKNYVLKLNNATNIGQVLRELENKGISNVNLLRVDNSEMEKYRKEVKIMAIKAAKDKADYLLNAIGEQTGKPIYIQERNNHPYYKNSNMIKMRGQSIVESANYQLDFEKMILKYEVFARFEIVE